MKSTISLLFLLAIFTPFFGNISASENEPQLTDQLKSKILDGIPPLKYGENILLKLTGNPIKVDSLIIKELVDTLNVLMDEWHVYLVKDGLSNLSVEIKNKNQGNNTDFVQQRDNWTRISQTSVVLNISPETDYSDRKQIIYFHVLRSLVNPRNNPVGKMISATVFTESSPNPITYQPIDYEIIKFLYSEEYSRKLEKKSNTSENTVYKLRFFIDLIAMLGAMIFLILISQKGMFKKHQYRFKSYFIQGIFVVCATIIYLIIRAIFSFYYSYPNSDDLLISYFRIIVVIVGVGVVSIVTIFLIERMIIKENENFIPALIVPLLTTMFIPFIFLLIINLIYRVIPSNINYQIVASVIPFTPLLGIARAFSIFIKKSSETIIRKKDLALAKLSELQKQSELQSLRARINPHFLYNALNSIASLATTDPPKTEKMALALSDFFKYSINRKEKQFNSISEELNAIRNYLEIEKVRFGDRLNFEIECNPELFELQIPQLLIQPLVENAIKHGLSKITGNGLIKIVITKDEKKLSLKIYDNGPAFPHGPLPGYGIRNTQERIILLYGKNASINWNNTPEKFIAINLTFKNQELF